LIVSSGIQSSVVLATLFDQHKNEIVIDPVSGEYYRLRVTGCDKQVDSKHDYNSNLIKSAET